MPQAGPRLKLANASSYTNCHNTQLPVTLFRHLTEHCGHGREQVWTKHGYKVLILLVFTSIWYTDYSSSPIPNVCRSSILLGAYKHNYELFGVKRKERTQLCSQQNLVHVDAA